MREKKAGTGKIVVIIILLLLFLGSSSYIVYDHFFAPSQKEEKVEKKEKKKEEKEEVKRILSVAEEKILLEQIEAYNEVLSDSYPIADIKKLDNQKKLYFGLIHLDTKKEIMQGDLKKVIDEYFGSDNGVVYENIMCNKGDGELYTYDESTNIFSQTGEHGHDGGGVYQNITHYLDGYVMNDTDYVVNAHVIYGNYCGGTCGPNIAYYKNAQDAKEGENAILDNEDEREFTDGDYQKIKDQLSVMTYTFQKDKNGNYGLKSVTIQ